ncbi:MAG: TonB-dependent receptor [Rhodanobacter sp.]|nr:MAG: TonB-dependent receptor [Rhodanobacter sp.]TAM09262.1 MAG: TonB-dependent receptor [Rhodanobacter sp.]TAM35935.1 MAG: TonB-dependent receptor [Rhodanobacter sp.]
MNKTLLAAALMTCMLPAYAADQNAASALDPVVVTATRTPVTVDDTLSAVTIVTRVDIERLQPLSVQDLLTGLPGVAIAQYGGLGQLSTLSLRGSNANHTLVLIDGVRIGSVTAGFAAIQQLPVDQIERIEIVRGPRSSLYGPDAIGGVIQIFTRHGRPNGGTVPSMSVTGGSRGLAGSTLGLSGGDAHAWYNASLGGQHTRGFPACRMGAAEAFAGCFVDDPRNDAFRNWNGALSGGWRWDNGAELSGNWLRSRNFVEYAGSPFGSNRALQEQRLGGARLAFAPLAAWKVMLSAGQSKDLSTTYYQGTYLGAYYPRRQTGYANSRRDQASWQNDVTLAPGQLLTAGVDWQREHVDSSTGYLADRRLDTGVFAQYQANWGANTLQASARRDHSGQFGNHSTGALAWGYAFDHGLRVSASYGTAFHAPTFNDLYFPPFFGMASANPQLRPETSRSAELGVQQQGDGWHWALNAYQTRINQMILLDATRNYVPFNLSRARIRGLEGQAGATLAGWQLAAYLTLQQPKNDDGGTNDGKLLNRRPERTLRVDLDRRFGAFGLGTTWYAASHSYDDVANTRRLAGYGILALRASWQLAPAWQLEGRLANAFDRRYETVYYYNQPGRTWSLTLRWKP